MAGDIFGRKRITPLKAITADMCTIVWDGEIVASASQITVQYSQPVTRRRALGGNGVPIAVIYPSQPTGQISISRLVSERKDNLFSKKGWNVCEGPADITIDFSGSAATEGCDLTGGHYVASGSFVTNFGFSAEAESLTVVDNISIEFLQLWQENQTASA